MSKYYHEVYKKRINRYGLDFQSRIQAQREKDFDAYLYKTIYRVDFEFEGQMYGGSLEHSEQDYTKTYAFLLTQVNVEIPNGTILFLISKDGSQTPWIIWWKERLEASGYNKYQVLKMSHQFVWETEENRYEQWGFLTGPGYSKIELSVESATAKALYRENDNLYTLVTPYNKNLTIDQYFEIEELETPLAFVITGIDILSTRGIMYITLDPVQIRNLENTIQTDNQEAAKVGDDSFWLNGGA